MYMYMYNNDKYMYLQLHYAVLKYNSWTIKIKHAHYHSCNHTYVTDVVLAGARASHLLLRH